MRSWEEIREDFPILKEKIHGKDLIYLDNAATTQLPQPVIDCFVEHYTKYNANVHRGIHYLSEQSTMHMEAVRDKVKAFLNGTNSWTRDSSQGSALYAERLNAGFGCLSYYNVDSTHGVRPAFVIDLSKVDYKTVGHVDYK